MVWDPSYVTQYVMEDYKVSIHSPLDSDGPGSILLDSVSLGNTTKSVYTPLCSDDPQSFLLDSVS